MKATGNLLLRRLRVLRNKQLNFPFGRRREHKRTNASTARSLAELIATGAYDTDKGPAGFLDTYERFFAPLRYTPIRLLELGVARGGSLALWRDYFPRGLIVGIDVDPGDVVDDTGRIRVYKGRQEDTEFLDRVASESAPHGFDIVVDDASHVAALTRVSFWHIFQTHLRAGGIYAIEDWGTGYWDSWSDGRRYERNHSFGMVGLVKELIDECGVGDITDPQLGIPPQRDSRFSRVDVSPGLAIVVKYIEER